MRIGWGRLGALVAVASVGVLLVVDSEAATQLWALAREAGGSVHASSVLTGAVSEEAGGLELRPPAVRGPDHPLEVSLPPAARKPREGEYHALAYQYHSHVFERPAERPETAGLVLRGKTLTATRKLEGPGCRGGEWYEVLGGHVVCSANGFRVSARPERFERRQLQPELSEPLPFRYGKVNTRDALRFYRIPTREEQTQIERALPGGDGALPEVVSGRLEGDYLVALDRVERDQGREFLRTVRGRYLRREQVDEKPLPPMRGELLEGRFRLPLAFVVAEQGADIVERAGGEVRRIGHAHYHARFGVASIARWGDRDIAVSTEGWGVPRDQVRVARRAARPAGIAAQDRWIRVDLDEQALVAYEGDRPVFATLVSSGLADEYPTPSGVFRVREKHISTTMRGEDAESGVYEVEEVPWTMYYYEGYALHGAYWHNEFGHTRSHGCTNIAPVDARWLFYWTSPEVPSGWHARRRTSGGTWVQFHRDS